MGRFERIRSKFRNIIDGHKDNDAGSYGVPKLFQKLSHCMIWPTIRGSHKVECYWTSK